jgi:hypothetical protein
VERAKRVKMKIGRKKIESKKYRTRFNGGATRSETSSDDQPTPCVVTSLTHPISTLPQSDKYKRRKKESLKERDK